MYKEKVFYNEQSDLVKSNPDANFNDNILLILDCVTVNRNQSSDNELANKKFDDESLSGGVVLKFNQSIDNHLKVYVGNDTYILTKHDKLQITDTKTYKFPNQGPYLLRNWQKMVKYKTL